MLRLFNEGTGSYQPAGLAFESDDPKTAKQNVLRLLDAGHVIQDILVRPTGALLIFTDGTQHYTPALRVGQDGRPTEALAEVAAEAGFGKLWHLLTLYTDMSPDFTGPLPRL